MLYILAFITFFWMPGLSFSQERIGYDSRPSILEISSKNYQQHKPENWEKLKEGMLKFISETLALYPEQEYFLLARDGEYIYDLAQVLFKDEPQIARRFHLLNISRSNNTSPNLGKYLEQEGLFKALKEGQGALIIDTCCEGSLFQPIFEAIPHSPDMKLAMTQLLVSENRYIPSSADFIRNIHSIEPLVLGQQTSEVAAYQSLIKTNMEMLPHYTQKSDRLEKIGDKIVPTSPQGETKYREGALALMQDLKEFGSEKQVKNFFVNDLKEKKELADWMRGKSHLNFDQFKKKLFEYEKKFGVGFTLDLHDIANRRAFLFNKERCHEFKLWSEARLKHAKQKYLESPLGKFLEKRPHLIPYVQSDFYYLPHITHNLENETLIAQLAEAPSTETKVSIVFDVLSRPKWLEAKAILDPLMEDYNVSLILWTKFKDALKNSKDADLSLAMKDSLFYFLEKTDPSIWNYDIGEILIDPRFGNHPSALKVLDKWLAYLNEKKDRWKYLHVSIFDTSDPYDVLDSALWQKKLKSKNFHKKIKEHGSLQNFYSNYCPSSHTNSSQKIIHDATNALNKI